MFYDVDFIYRIEFDCAHHEFIGFPLHSIGRMVGRGKGHWTGHMGWDDLRVRWHCALCAK